MLNEVLKRIAPLDQAAMTAAAAHQEQLAIPQGSLGRLHAIGVRLAGITGDPRPRVARTAVITMAGDHGVAAQGVSRFPQEVTREMVANFIRGGAAINVLAGHFGARLTVVDIGVAGALPQITPAASGPARLLTRRVADGTADMSLGPAMTRPQARQAIETGIQVFEEEYAAGLDAVGTGDMGIANTTPSAAIAAALLQCDPEDIVNRGTGIDDDALVHKTDVVRRSLQVNGPDPQDPLDVLAKVGGLEIGGITGVILGACARRVPVVIDGFISTAAALLAVHLHPLVGEYLFSGHQSAVDGHGRMLTELQLVPLIDLGMRLGEGTGAAFGLAILGAASCVATRMLTFSEAAVSGPGGGS